MLAISHSSVLPSARWNGVGALISDLFHGSITLPACSPVNASRAALRLPAHDSGPGWLATPYLYDSCIRDFTPVYPGALQHWVQLARSLEVNFGIKRCRINGKCES
jgi:hypothetical protein